MISKFLSAVIILTFIQLIALAQTPVLKHKEFSEESWKKATEELNYTLVPEKKESKPRKINEGLDFNLFSLNNNTAKVSFFILIILFLLLIAWMVFKNYVHVSPEISENKNPDVEENIYEINLEEMLKSALERKDYKQAIRYYYLIILKMLASENLIEWKKEKTNYEYLREMKYSNYYKDFRSLTNLFENIWYSDLILQEYYYNNVSLAFKKFIEQKNT